MDPKEGEIKDLKIHSLLSKKDLTRLKDLEDLLLRRTRRPFLALVGLDTERLKKTLLSHLKEISPLPLEEHKKSENPLPFDTFSLGDQSESKKIHLFYFIKPDPKASLERVAANLMFYRDFIPQYSLNIIIFCSHSLLRVIMEKAYELYAFAGFADFFCDREDQMQKDLTPYKGKIPKKKLLQQRLADLQEYKKVKMHDPHALLSKLFKTASAAMKIFEIRKAFKLYEEALPLARSAGKKEMLASIHCYMGIIFQLEQELDEALKNHKQALEYWVKTKNLKGLASGLNNLGRIFRLKGNYETALKHHRQALESFEKAGDIPGKAYCLGYIGRTFLEKGDYQSAKHYFHKSFSIFKAAGHKPGLAISLDNLGRVYLKLGQVEDALNLFRKSLAIFKKIDNLKGEADVFVNMGTAYARQDDLPRARKYLERGLEISQQTGFKLIQETAQEELQNISKN